MKMSGKWQEIMKRDPKRKRTTDSLLLLCIILLLCVGAFAGYRQYIRTVQEKNQTVIQEHVDALTFMQSNWETEVADLRSLLTLKYLTDAQNGFIYERLSSLDQINGDRESYYQDMAYALFYLQEAGNYEAACNIYLDLAKYFFQIGADEKAGAVIDRAYELKAPESYEDPQVLAYLYRMKAVSLTKAGEGEEALSYLELAENVVEELDSSVIYRDAYLKMIDVEKAAADIAMGDYAAAEAVLEQYAEDESLMNEDEVQYLVTDFCMPYYETKIKVAIINEDYGTAIDCYKIYNNYCERYSYLRCEVDAMREALEVIPSGYVTIRKEFTDKLDQAGAELTAILVEEHGSVLGNQLDNTVAVLDNAKREQEAKRERWIRFLIYLFFGGLALVIYRILYLQMMRDGLTALNNRRALNYRLQKFEKIRRAYHVIMMDIDDFKKINDVYGHEFGDEVLCVLGRILKSYESSAVKAYRYGGEEFTMVIEQTDEDQVMALAESIRKAVESEKWDNGVQVTISLGIGNNVSENDPLRHADENLYRSKKNGKNQVTGS